MKQLIFDFDALKYAGSAVGEKRSIVVRHPSGIEEQFSTRTMFHGHWRNKDGGWLAEYNKDKSSPLLPDEFSITDVQTPGPVENVLHTIKSMIYKACAKTDIDEYVGYIGKGDSFRVEMSTLLKYKGQRAAMLRPLHIEAVEEYLIKHHDGIVVRNLEADDKIVMECYDRSDRTAAILEKDFYGIPKLNLYNTDSYESLYTGNGYGKLYLDAKGKVKGYGRAFFYFQVLSGDTSDNYKANCFSDVKWADKKAFAMLAGCKNDSEALQALVKAYKILYPEPKTVVGWRGDEINIDWFYVLNENFQLARLLRWDDDKVDLKKVLEKSGVEV